MKKTLSIVLLSITIIDSAQDNTVSTTPRPVVTEIGKPNGEKAEMKSAKKAEALLLQMEK